MIGARKIAAVAALLAFAGLIVTSEGANPLPGRERLILTVWTLLPPLLLLIGALLVQVYWGRWAGLATGLAVLPWAAALSVVPGDVHRLRPLLALVASLSLLVSLSGRAMLQRYEGRAGEVDWRGPRMALVRWTIVATLAAVLSLYMFAAAYVARIAWHALIPAALLLGLLPGVLLLARGKTAGLLLVGFCCVWFVPAGVWFVRREATGTGEIVLFIAAFLPAVVLGWAVLAAFAAPLARYLRST